MRSCGTCLVGRILDGYRAAVVISELFKLPPVYPSRHRVKADAQKQAFFAEDSLGFGIGYPV